MILPNGIVYGSRKQIIGNICEKICFYIECANITMDILMDRCGYNRNVGQKIINQRWDDVTFCDLLRICEALCIRYDDLFELSEGKEYINKFNDSRFVAAIEKAMAKRNVDAKTLCEKLNVSVRQFYNWKSRKSFTVPFIIGNIIEFLQIKASDVCQTSEKTYKENEEKTQTKEKEQSSVEIANSVIKAYSVYSEVDNIISALDGIILKATELKEKLEKLK